MALDEPKENDEVFNDDGIAYLINRQLYEQAKPISVDFITTYMGSGFSIASNLASANSCSSSCSC